MNGNINIDEVEKTEVSPKEVNSDEVNIDEVNIDEVKTGAAGPVIDRNIENTMGTLLRAGVISAAVLVFTGAIYYLIKYGSHIPEYSVFKGEPEDFSTLGGILKSFIALRSRGIIMFGLVVLIFTPVARVVFSLVAFAIQKDYIYTVVSTIVLIILLLGFFDII